MAGMLTFILKVFECTLKSLENSSRSLHAVTWHISIDGESISPSKSGLNIISHRYVTELRVYLRSCQWTHVIKHAMSRAQPLFLINGPRLVIKALVNVSCNARYWISELIRQIQRLLRLSPIEKWACFRLRIKTQFIPTTFSRLSWRYRLNIQLLWYYLHAINFFYSKYIYCNKKINMK